MTHDSLTHLTHKTSVLARKTYLITARARKNKRAARMLASARKDHSIPLIYIFAGPESVNDF